MQGFLLNSILNYLRKKQNSLEIGLIQIHSKNETNTFEKIFWVQGCYEDYFLYTLKVRGWFIFYGNPQLQVPFPIYMNLFRLKTKNVLKYLFSLT
ncbi:hypothetical protein Murru_0831 [Allomuricauda ruestringensis DSM 13258]|uniref:Uncharacterized protein n=1 Tax=Allomuricauda ruestringensis (strain DSM 13258 / CIP 107369 / LMG 19739 / B1) TaxID=886377 RepID=G2PKA4_ALLRU|nr:hypothetical protein Murru_0831 [Allomuricauda ruestringensis DSM 13258]